MSGANGFSLVAADAIVGVLDHAIDAAAHAFVAAYPDHLIRRPHHLEDGPPANPVDAADVILQLAEQLQEAIATYQQLVEQGAPLPPPDSHLDQGDFECGEHHEDGDDDIPW